MVRKRFKHPTYVVGMSVLKGNCGMFFSSTYVVGIAVLIAENISNVGME